MTILVIEDDKEAAQHLKKILEFEHYTVEVAYNGEEGLEKSEINDYDVIILDILLPNMDGFAVCRKLREMKINTQIIMVTCKDGVDDKVRGLDAGADDYLPKPYEPSELLARIRSLLRREKHVKPAILRIADLTLDPAAHEVKRGGELIQLSGKEYKLLDYMMRRPGRVCSRNMIGEHIWGFSWKNCRSKVIEAFISSLRKKIDHGFRRKLIYTVRDYGYKIQDKTLSVNRVG